MKLKGVNPIEQHIEKIVLVVVGVIFLAVVSAQFLLQPNRIKVGNQTVLPGHAFAAAKERADRLRDVMRRTDMALPDAPAADLTQQFLASREAPVAPVRAYALGRAPQIDQVDRPIAMAGQERISPFEVPAPQVQKAYSPRGTVDPFEVVRTPELAAFVPAEQPFDKAGVSVEGIFKGVELRNALLASRDGAKAMPAAWWRDRVEILSVTLEREERTATGEWTNLTTIEPIPGRPRLKEQLRQVQSVALLDEVVAEARAMAEEIRRPEYLPLIAGPEWVPPTEAARQAPRVMNPEIERLLREKENVERQLADAEKKAEELQGDGGDGGGAGPGGGGRRPPGGGGERPQPESDRERRNLEMQIARHKRTLGNIEQQLAQQGYEVAPRQAEAIGGTRTVAARSLLENPAVRLWAHDITVQPGKTYRYRMAVEVNNPVFGREAALLPEDRELAGRPSLVSQYSDWSEPVPVLHDRYFFIRSANEGSLGAPAGAVVEVFEFFYGYYRRGSIRLEPGDLVAARVQLPEGSQLPIFPLRRGANGGDERELPELGDERTAEARPWDKPVVAVMEHFLLDVAALPGAPSGSQARAVAYLRGEGGAILARRPDQDLQSQLYRWVSQSAQEGENQGQPTPRPDPVKPQPPQQPGPGKPEPPSKGPGGGGGPGGG
jgi:hypothetical protein